MSDGMCCAQHHLCRPQVRSRHLVLALLADAFTYVVAAKGVEHMCGGVSHSARSKPVPLARLVPCCWQHAWHDLQGACTAPRHAPSRLQLHHAGNATKMQC